MRQVHAKVSVIALAAGAALAAMPAAAQEVPDPVERSPEPGDPDGDEPRPFPTTTGVRDIIVTATRRQESLQSVPVAVTALDAETLDNPAIDDIRDIASRVPSLVIDPVNAGPQAAAISIRGISFEDIEKSFDPAVGVVVDGVPIGTNTGQLLDAFDLESVEVLRGPQGTLFGRNTIAGVINIRRTRPTNDFGVKASLGYAEFGTYQARAVVNTGLIGDFLAVKLFGFYDDTDGFIDDAVTGENVGRNESWRVGATARLVLNDAIDAEITYEHGDSDGEVVVVPTSTDAELICLQVPVPGVGLVRAFGIPDRECNRYLGPRGPNVSDEELYTSFQNIATPLSYRTDSVTGEINVSLGAFNLVSITGYQTSEESVRQDFDASSISFFDTLRVQEYEQLTQEVRLSGNVTDDINVLVGGFFFDSSYDLDQTTNLGFAGFTLTQFVRGESTSYAAFADAEAGFGDLTLRGGIRYSYDEKALSNNFGFTADGSCPLFFGITEDACVGEEDFDEITYRLAADYQVGDDQLVYASYSTGYRSGGFNGRAASPTSLGPYQPETVTAYEVGLKADWIDNTLRTNIALFRTEYDDKQEEVVQATQPPFDANPQETVVENAASARIDGAELEFQIIPTYGLSFSGTFTYLDAEYDEFFRDVDGDLVPDDVSSLDLRRSPDVIWSFGVDYEREFGSGAAGFSTLFRYTDNYTTCIVADRGFLAQGIITNDRRCERDDVTNLDATIYYEQRIGGADVKFSVFGRNILDDRGINSTLPVAGLFAFSGLRPPQQFGAEVEFEF